MVKRSSGLDPSGEQALCLSGHRASTGFKVTGFTRFALADAPRQVVAGGAGLTVGLTGKDLILKYTKVPAVPDWQLLKLMDFEVSEIASQAGGQLAFDYNLLPLPDELAATDVSGEDTILLALARAAELEERSAELRGAGARISAFTPNPIALYNAFLLYGSPVGDDTVLLAWIGESSMDLALLSGTSLLFARNVSGGLAIFDGAIAQSFNVRDERARRIRRELLDLEPRSDPTRKGAYASSQEEKVSHSVQGVAGQLLAALRSTVAFCQSQTKIPDLSLDRAFVCGPGAAVRGLPAFLREGIGVEVEVFDPSAELDFTGCDPEDAREAVAAGPELILALGLAVGPCYDELYAIEILPEAEKRRRRFATRGVFNLVAAVLVLAWLAFDLVTSRESHAHLGATAAVFAGRQRSVQGVHDRTKALIARNAEMRDELAALEAVGMPLYASRELLRSLQRTKPADLWITRVKSEEGTANWAPIPEGGARRRRAPKRKYLVVEGRGLPISGADSASVVYPAFHAALKREGVPIQEDRPSPGGPGKPFAFELKVDYLVPEPKGGGR